MIHLTRLEHIRPNPWQPRLRENVEKVEELAESLLENVDRLPRARRGLLQIPLARVVDLEGVPLGGSNTHGTLLQLAEQVEAGEACAQLAFGHRRYAAFRELAAGGEGRKPDERFAAMPLELAMLTDRQMAEIAFRENVERDDLTWYEIATSVNRFTLDFGATQEEAARVFGFGSRGSIANYLRALRVIEECGNGGLEQLAIDGYLPLLHVLHLAPLLRDYPHEAHAYLEDGGIFTGGGEVRPASAIKADVDAILAALREDPDEGGEERELEGGSGFELIEGEIDGHRVWQAVPQVAAGPEALANAPEVRQAPADLRPTREQLDHMIAWFNDHDTTGVDTDLAYQNAVADAMGAHGKNPLKEPERASAWESLLRAAIGSQPPQPPDDAVEEPVEDTDDTTLPAWLADDTPPPAVDRTLDALSFTVFRLAEAVGGLQDALEGVQTVEDEAILEHALRVASTAVNPVREMLGTLIRPAALVELRGQLAGIEGADERRKVIAGYLWEKKPTRIVTKQEQPVLSLTEPDGPEVVA